jgi:hypothetical protein
MTYPGSPPFIFRCAAHYQNGVAQLGLGYSGAQPSLIGLTGCGFDVIWDFVLDGMHNLFLGVTKTIFQKVWFGPVWFNCLLIGLAHICLG